MANVSAQPRLAGRNPIEVVIDRTWRFFCSVRAAVAEIVILAFIVLMGTLAGSSAPQALADLVPVTEPFVTWWYNYNWWHSLPFELILTVLAIAITICTINRAPGIWHTIAHPTVTTTRGFLRRAEPSAHFTAVDAPDELTSRLTKLLRGNRYRVLTVRRDEDIHLYADKNRFAKLGTFPFHLALILILVGGIVGARYGFRNQQFIVPVGSTREVGHNTGLSLKVTSFTDTYLANTQPHKYQADVIVYKNGQAVKSGPILVNHPMTYDGVTFYQASFGDAASLRITDSHGNVLYDDSVPLGTFQSRYNPNQPAGVLNLPQGYQINVIAPSTEPGIVPNIPPMAPGAASLNVQSGQMYIEARANNASATAPFVGAIVNQGQAQNIDGLHIEFLRERRFSLLQVSKNPGIPIFELAAFFLIFGLVVTFYFPHRRVRGIISRAPSGASTQLAALARRDWSGQRDFHRLLAEIEQQLGVRPILIEHEAPVSQAVAVNEAADT